MLKLKKSQIMICQTCIKTELRSHLLRMYIRLPVWLTMWIIQVASTSEFIEYWWKENEIIFSFMRLSAEPQQLEHRVDHTYFTLYAWKNLGAFFNHQNTSNNCIKNVLEIEIFLGLEVLKLYFKGSKNSRSKHIRTPKYLCWAFNI